MEFVKKIREDILKKNPYEMYKLMGLNDTRSYLDFENRSESLNAKKLVKLWQLSGLSGDAFMEMIAKEVESQSEQPK
jgi:hypothetical protein